MRRVARLVTVLVCLLLAGCGAWTQDRPVTIDVPVPTRPSQAEPDPGGPRALTVYFVRDDRLAPAERAADDRSITSALGLLVSGPTADEARSGLRTALSAATLGAARNGDDAVVVEVTRELIATPGTDQLLAVAQVVWTVTAAPGAPERVRLTSDGAPIEVPTDAGLLVRPVTRDDFRTVAPARGSSPRPSAGAG